VNDWGRGGSTLAVAVEHQDAGFQNGPVECDRNVWRERQKNSGHFEREQIVVEEGQRL